MESAARNAEGLQILLTVTRGYRVRDIDERLRRLTDRDGGNHAVLERIDHRDGVGVFKPDIDPSAIARGPEAMPQVAYRYGGGLLEIVGAIDRDLRKPA